MSDGNGSEKKKMCVEVTLSNAKVRTQDVGGGYLCKIRLKLSSVCRLFGANWCISVLTWKIEKMAL